MITFEKQEVRTDLFTQAGDEMNRLISSALANRATGRSVKVAPPTWGHTKRRVVENSSIVAFNVTVGGGFLAGALAGIAGASTLLATVVAAVVAVVNAEVCRAVFRALRDRMVLVDDPTATAVWSVLEDALRLTARGKSALADALHAELKHVEFVVRGDLEHLGRLDNDSRHDVRARDRVLKDLAEAGTLSLAALWYLGRMSSPHLVDVTPRKGGVAGAKDELIRLISPAAG